MFKHPLMCSLGALFNKREIKNIDYDLNIYIRYRLRNSVFKALRVVNFIAHEITIDEK